jgi:hypothetical protein
MSGTAADKHPGEHTHVWGRWFPKSNTKQWRECSVLGCHDTQERQAPR